MKKLKLDRIPKEQAEKLVKVQQALGGGTVNLVVPDGLGKLAYGFAGWSIPAVIVACKEGKYRLAIRCELEAEMLRAIAVYNEYLLRRGEADIIWKKEAVYIGWNVVTHEINCENAPYDYFCHTGGSGLAVTDFEAAEAFGQFLERLPSYFDWNQPF